MADCSHRIEWFKEINRLDHVRPENEIQDRLRPADYDKKSDQTKCQPPINAPITSPTLWGLATALPCHYGVLPARLRDDKRARNSLGD
jgi:hypothetical protein